MSVRALQSVRSIRRNAAAVALTAWLAWPAATVALSADAEPGSAKFRSHLLVLINQYRAGSGLEPLQPSEHLSALAAEHSEYMRGQRRISHERFAERFNRSFARVCVENVGVGYRYPQAQLDGWVRSPGHNRNLLDPKLRHVGIAMTDVYVTFLACG